MSHTACRLTVLVLCATGLAPVTAAQAQWGGANRPPPLYPHELQPGQSYAVEVAPNTYVIHRPQNQRVYPYVSPSVSPPPPRRYRAPSESTARSTPQAAPKPKRTHADRGLIEELRRRAAKKAAKQAAKASKHVKASKHEDAARRPDEVINTKQIVREKPVVIETRRVVDDPPEVITRYHVVDDEPSPPPSPPRRRPAGHTGSIAPKAAATDDPRVIHADAEITILGPDRMSLRLIRKDGQALDVNARAKKVK